MQIVADAVEGIDADGTAGERKMSHLVWYMRMVACGSDPVHRTEHRRETDRCRRQAEKLRIAVDDQLGGEFRDAIKALRHHMAVFRQRLVCPVRPMAAVNGA